MAERRMFAKTIIDSDAFLDMPLSAQALYFHLSMRADDDGFINNPKKIQRMVGASEDDCKLLLLKRFLITFESGVVVIKHWKIHNYIRSDRYKPTVYQTEKALLEEKDNKSYTEKNLGIPNGRQMETQGRLGQVSIELVQDRAEVVERGMETEDNCGCDNENDPLNELQSFRYDNVFLSDNQVAALLEVMDINVFDAYVDKITNYPNVKNHYETILKWYNEDKAVKK